MNFYDENSTYEMFNNYEDEIKDILYLKDLYPASFMSIQNVVDDECDRLEYDGSIMFDEFPDKERLRRLEEKVYEKVKTNLEKTSASNQTGRGMPAEEWLKDIVCVLLINEMMRRRSRRRIGRRGFC